MSGPNVIPFNPNRRIRTVVLGDGTIAMLVFMAFDAMVFLGLMTAFLVTRVAAGDAWPPAGQPWFQLGETTLHSAALLGSGLLVLRAARTWERPEARIGPLLLAAIALGTFFAFFQGLAWVKLIRAGLSLTSSQHGSFFCLMMGTHGAHTLGALLFMGVAWLRLKPLREDEEPRGSPSWNVFSIARILWYFVVGVWPILYLCVFL
ncbi:MAG: heme-copper oxidase subunit III [Myxococcota bacterium]